MTENSQKKIISVTGATGFVGQHLISALCQKGYQVKALTRRPPRRHQENMTAVEWIEGDFHNKQALDRLLQDSSAVFHLAGAVKGRNLEDFSEANILSVQKIRDILAHKNHKAHLFLLSSLAAREPHLSHYASSKRAGEECLSSSVCEFPWTIIRPPGIYGPGDLETLKIFKAISYGLAPIPGNRANRASWIYVHDLVQGLCALIDEETHHQKILNIDDGRKDGYSMEELYDIAAKVMGRKALKITLPKFALNLVAHLNMGFSQVFGYTPMISPKKVNELYFPDWICRGEHVMTCSPWQPEKQLEDGLKETFDWYRQNKLL